MIESTFDFPQLDQGTLPGPETIGRWELKNGITMLARENFASPSVVISGYLPVGSLLDKAGQSGCGYLTAQGLIRGTKEKSAQEIFEAVESIGARLGFSAGVHSTSFHGKGLAEDLELLLNLLLEVLRTPTFPKVEMERLQAQLLTALAIRQQDTSARAHLAFDEIAYKDHPYRIPSDGNIDSVGSLTPNHICRFHREHYRPNGMVLAIVGGVGIDRAHQAVEKILGSWEARGVAERVELPALVEHRTEQRTRIDLPGKQQSDIVVGVPGPSRLDPGYLAAALGNHILGRFGMMGRIGEAVREKAGLAYYAYSSVSGGLGPGPWQVTAGVNPENEERALDLIKAEIRRFTQKRVHRDELQESQANLIGRLPLQLESNEGVAGALTHIERYSLGLDYYQRYPVLIQAMSRDEILQTAQRFLDPDRMVIAVAGPSRK